MTQQSAQQEVDPETASGRERWFLSVVRTMRPHQWVKNLFVLAPLFFSQAYWHAGPLARGVAAALLFSLMAGTVYLVNDILDRERDRRHPTKRHRPIAAGRLSVRRAVIAAAVVGICTAAGAVVLDPGFAVVLLAYLVMNLAYSKVLKHWAFVDVGVIATGFVLRVVAGGLAVGVFLSEWLLGCTFLLACFLALGKRRHEMAMAEHDNLEGTRKGWEKFRAEQLDVGLFFVGGMTVAGYTIYALTASLPDQPLRTQHTPFSSPWLPVTVPLVVAGLARFFQLSRRTTPISPTEAMLRDWWVLAVGVAWVGALLALGIE